MQNRPETGLKNALSRMYFTLSTLVFDTFEPLFARFLRHSAAKNSPNSCAMCTKTLP